MKTEIFAKNYKVSAKLNSLILKKLQKFDKIFPGDIKAKVQLRQEKDTYTLELTIYADRIFRAEVSSREDMFSNIDTAIAKIFRQIEKYKDRLSFESIRNFDGAEAEGEAQEEQPIKAPVRKKTYLLKPMSVEEAQMQMELVDHDFFVFMNEENSKISVIYRRNDGNIGLIETVV